MGLEDDLLEDARHLAAKGIAEQRPSCMRRAISTAYYAVFHLLIQSFVKHWPFVDQRAKLARMFSHQKMRDAAFKPNDKKNLTQIEAALGEVIKAFSQLQADRHRADYDTDWAIVATDVESALNYAETAFGKWRLIEHEEIARNHLLAMFGASR